MRKATQFHVSALLWRHSLFCCCRRPDMKTNLLGRLDFPALGQGGESSTVSLLGVETFCQ